MSEIKVPELGESIVEATVLRWMKQVGDAVGQGEAVAELETDKVNVEVIAEEAGVLSSILHGAGDTVKVGEAIAVMAQGAVAAAASQGLPANPAPENPAQSTMPPAPDPSTSAGPTQTPVTGGQAAPSSPAPLTNGQAASLPQAPGMASRATPAIRRLAHERGIDLSELAGSGGFGRITEADVLRHSADASKVPQAAKSQSAPVNAGPSVNAAPSVPATPVADRPDEVRQRMSRRRLTIAKRLVEVQHTAAMLTTFNEVDMTRVMELRKQRKDRFKEEHGISLGFMSFFTKAAVAALRAFPHLNAEIQGEDIVEKHHYDIGIAVAAEGGLVVPVVRNADRLSFAGIEEEIARLAKKARDNTLGLDDLAGGTFTITNGGIFGSLFSTPILNPPQVGILGMHGIQERPVAVNGQVEIHPMMYIALSYDHRIVDGAEAVRFLVKIKQLLEDPELLLLEG